MTHPLTHLESRAVRQRRAARSGQDTLRLVATGQGLPTRRAGWAGRRRLGRQSRAVQGNPSPRVFVGPCPARQPVLRSPRKHGTGSFPASDAAAQGAISTTTPTGESKAPCHPLVVSSLVVRLIGLILVQYALFSSPTVEAQECFPSIFAFGDGQFDTGSISAVFPSLLNYDYPPYGSTHFGKPSGRFSDGRLVLDFLCEALGVPKLPSYAQTVSSDFSKGVSFGSAFSTVGTVSTGQTAGPFMFLNPFSLPMQVAQYTEFKATTGVVHASQTIPLTKRVLQEGETTNAEETTIVDEDAHAKARLPLNDHFVNGLYLVATGRHDIVNFYNMNLTVDYMESKFEDLMAKYGLAIRTFAYAKYTGAKNVIVFDVEPLGCQPFLLTLLPHTDEELDQKGCLIAVNELVQKFNKKLKRSVKSWRNKYEAQIVYLSIYDITINLMNDAESGFTATNFACCGVDTSPYNVNRLVPCGPPGVDITTNPPTPLASTTCSSPSTHLYWDGFYTTEAANRYITEKILTGDYFDVPFDYITSCSKKEFS
ncbi:unnamed protein product [Calypogeia fissa]